MSTEPQDPMDNARDFAFRVESLPEYRVGGEEEFNFSQFLKGEPLPENNNAEWSHYIRELRAKDVRVLRLRLVSSPLTDYERFELEAAYAAGMAAGEDIRVALRDDYGPTLDFWLYDAQTVEWLDFDSRGSFLGSRVEQVDSGNRDAFSRWIEVFDASQSASEYLTAYRD